MTARVIPFAPRTKPAPTARRPVQRPVAKATAPMRLFFGALGNGEFGLYGIIGGELRTLAVQHEPYTPEQRASKGCPSAEFTPRPLADDMPTLPAGYARGLEVQQRRHSFRVVS